MPQKTGRPRIPVPEEFPEYYSQWKAGKIYASIVMSELGLSKSTFYRMAEAYEIELERAKFEQERQDQQKKENQETTMQKMKQFVQKMKKTGKVN